MTIASIEFTQKDKKRLSPNILRKVQVGMERDGAVALANLFPLSLLKKLRAEVLRRHNSGELHGRGLVRDIGGRYAAVLPFEGPFLTPLFYGNSKVLEIMSSLLGASYCIGSLEAVIARPGAYKQHQHIDGPLRFDRMIGKTKRGYQGDLSGLPPFAVTLCVPLCDVNEENGPTAIWRGSHRAALRARPPGEKELARQFPIEYMAGDFGRSFIFDFRAFHCGMPNFSAEARPLLMFVFTRSWYRDPNQAEVHPSVVITKRNFSKIPSKYKELFTLAPASRRALWKDDKT